MTRRALVMLAVIGTAATPAAATPPGPNGKLVFNCPASESPTDGVFEAICTMNPDGTEFRKIVDGAGINAQAVWSPDGTKIAFSSSRNSTPPVLGSFGGDIWVVNADGSNPIQLTHSSTDGSPAWSPDGRIAFTSFRDHIDDHSFMSSIYVMNADGSNQHAVTTVDTVTFDTEPAWSPDGRRIAFIRSDQLQRGAGIDGGFEEIYTVNDDGSNVRQLTVVPDFIATYGVSKDHPTWSPDGTRIAFIESPWLDFDLAGYIVGVVNADGSDEHFLTRNSDSLPDGPNVDILDVAWSPDGRMLAGSCSYAAPTTTPGSHLCLIDAATGEITGPIGPLGFAVYPDWGRPPTPTNLTITDCNDPRLADAVIPGSINVAGATCTTFTLGANSVGGDVILTGDTAITEVNLGTITTIGGNVTLTGDTAITEVNLGSVTTIGGSVTLTGDTAITEVNLGSITTIGSNVTLTGDTAITEVNLGSVTTIGGSVTLTGDTAITDVNLGSITTIGGSVTITGNSKSTVVNLGGGVSIGGNLTLESAGDSVNLGATQTTGGVTIVANGSNSISGLTGGTATDLSILGGIAAMRVRLPNGAFAQPVPFTISRLLDLQSEAGSAGGGLPALITPLGGYRFSFAVPALNSDADLAFRIDLAQLDADTRAAVLAGVQNGATTIAVKGDAAGSAYQAFTACTGVETPQTDGCVSVTLMGGDGSVVMDPALAAFVNLSGVAAHFSTWSVVLVTPDRTPPNLTITLTAPNSGTPDGQQGWFVTGPVTGMVRAEKTGGVSGITSLTCGSLPLTVSGLGTRSATGTFTIGSDGITDVVCTATDGAGNTSAAAAANIRIDRTAPSLAPTVTPAQIPLNGTAAATPNASDSISGIAAASCGTIDTSTAGPHTVTCTATDNAGNVASATASYTVIAPSNVCLGEPAHQVLAPIAADGSAVFVRGLPVPVRFRVCDSAGRSISSKLVSSLRLVGTITGGLAQSVDQPVRSALADVGFFWDPLLQEWDFLLATDVLKAGTTYVYDIRLLDGSHIGFRFKVVDRPRW